MPSMGDICISMRTTSGRLPSESSWAQASSASSPPPTSATTSRSGSPSRKACSPRRTTSWSSTTRILITPSDSIAVRSILLRDIDSYHGSPAGHAQDRKRCARLGGARAHRVEAVVAGVVDLHIEAGAVVSDLEGDCLAARSDVDPGPPRIRVLDDVRERLAADGEELGLGGRADRQPLLGPTNGHRQAFRVAERRGVPGERGDEPFVPRRAVQLEEEIAHLTLSAGGQLRDRVQGSRDRPTGIDPVLRELPLCRARVQHGREECLRDGVVEVAGDPVALFEGPLALTPPRLLELPQGPLPLADERPDEERRDRRDGNVELCAQRA